MLKLKNNYIMAPVKTGYSDGSGVITEKHISFYSKRSKYLGAIAIEPLYMDAGLRELPTQIGIDNDNKIEGLKQLTNIIHQFDTKVIAHLNHPGRMANPKIPNNYFLSSSDIACEAGGATPERIDKKGIEGVIELFVNSAIRAQKAGFDIIELQFGHGYLISQFISPKINNRTDEYGGTFENRIKLAIDILIAVKSKVNLPIFIRLSGDEMIPNGINIDEMIAFSKVLKQIGIEAIHVSAGSVCSTPPWYFQHMFVPKGKTWELANKIKTSVNIPIIFVGQINTKEDIEVLTNKYKADYIAMGRALVADPDFIGIIEGKTPHNYRPCMDCSQGCLGGVKAGKGLECLVNPTVGLIKNDFEIATQPEKIAIVGGGLAGMEAAVTLSMRGHEVDLFEKNELGGQFNYAHLSPKKQSMSKIVPFYIKTLKELNVNIIKQEATENNLLNNYNKVVVASGSVPSKLPIIGLTNFYWAEILNKNNMPKNKNVLIIGGGLIGVDVATAMVANNNKVVITKRTDDFGGNMEMIAKKLSLKMLNEHNAVLSDHTHIKEIDGKKIYAEKNSQPIEFNDIDIIVVSAGMKSFNPLVNLLKNKIEVFVIGDANELGDAQSAIKNAYLTAIKI